MSEFFCIYRNKASVEGLSNESFLHRLPHATVLVTGHTLATSFHVARNRMSKEESRQCVQDLLEWAQAAPIANVEAANALDHEMTEFEDALELSAAVACGARIIITRNISDFTKDLLPVMTPEEFLAQ